VSNQAHKIAVTISIVLIILALALAFLLRSLFRPPMPQLPEPKTSPVSQASDIATETVRANAHPIHKGGVHSVTELLRLINSDPGAAAHYRALGFRPECASTMILATNTWARVSYRTDSGFAWTQRPILLLAGEDMLVDCEGHIIRMACANAVMLAEKTAQMDTGELWGDLIPPVDFTPAPNTPQPVPPVPSGPVSPLPPVLPPIDRYPVPCCLVPFGAPVGSPPVATPEPHTALLLISGWTCVLVIYRIIRGCNPGRKS
jgi:hypothetical protein